MILALNPQTEPLIFNEAPRLYQQCVADIVGVPAATFIQQLHYRLLYQGHEHDGKNWFYNTIDNWVKEIGSYSKRTIERIVSELRENSLIETTTEYNRHKTDRKLWYTINYEELAKLILPNPAPEIVMSSEPESSIPSEPPQVNIVTVDEDDTIRQTGGLETAELTETTTRHDDGIDTANLADSYITKNTTENSTQNSIINKPTLPENSTEIEPEPQDVCLSVSSSHQPMFDQLISYGIDKNVAKEFVETHSSDYLEQKITYLDYAKETPKGVKNEAGYLCDAIREDYNAPYGYVSPEELAQQERDKQEQKEQEIREANERLDEYHRIREEREREEQERLVQEQAEQQHIEMAMDAVRQRDGGGQLNQEMLDLWEDCIFDADRWLDNKPYLLGAYGNIIVIAAIGTDFHRLKRGDQDLLNLFTNRFNRAIGYHYNTKLITNILGEHSPPQIEPPNAYEQNVTV